MNRIIELPTAEATRSLGCEIAKTLNARPALIYLCGELGAGKTTLAQGFVSALADRHENVLSPTYAYVQSYDGNPPIHHFDLYRLESLAELTELGLDEVLADQNAIRLIEWPEILGDGAKPDIVITLKRSGQQRKAHIRLIEG